METRKGLPVLFFETQDALEAWLEGNHAASGGIWIKFAKKASGITSVTYAEAVEAALCYGWIDGQAASFDDRFWLQRFTRRRARSKWSKVNRARVVRLAEQGRMKPSGTREVEAARQDGRWEAAYDSPSTMTVPDDFQQMLDANPRAAAFFENLDRSSRYAILYRIQDAKRPETRTRRITQFIDLLNAEKKAP